MKTMNSIGFGRNFVTGSGNRLKVQRQNLEQIPLFDRSQVQ